MIVSPVNSFQRVLDFINGAKTTLDVEVMYIADATIQAAIANAAGRGVTVRVIVEDPNDTTQNAGVAAFMATRGIPVKYAVQQFYLHAKLLIADGVTDAALNRLTGKVTDVVYQGESLRVFLQLADGTSLSLRQPSHYQASRLLPPVGGELTVTLHPEDTIVVPKAQEDARK